MGIEFFFVIVVLFLQIKPVTNQVELNPFFVQERLREFSATRGVVLTGYSPLGAAHGLWARPDKAKNLLRDPRLEAIGEKYGKGAAQVVLRWMVSLWAAFCIAVDRQCS